MNYSCNQEHKTKGTSFVDVLPTGAIQFSLYFLLLICPKQIQRVGEYISTPKVLDINRYLGVPIPRLDINTHTSFE